MSIQIPIFLFLRSKKGIVINTQVKSVSSYNRLGKFDILPIHAQFISLIEGNVSITHMDGKVEDIPVGTGIVKVVQNNVSIFLTDKQ